MLSMDPVNRMVLPPFKSCTSPEISPVSRVKATPSAEVVPAKGAKEGVEDALDPKGEKSPPATDPPPR